MSHQEVIQKKRDRLHKYTGAKLRRKTAALERAMARLDGKPTLKSADHKVNSKKAAKPVNEPEWNVLLPDGGSIKVKATSTRKARENARNALGLQRLPVDTNVIKAASE